MRPRILALDFDGVVLNGLREYFQTAWRAYQQIWPVDVEKEVGPEQLATIADRFYRLRPVIETGWEMPVLVRALLMGVADDRIEASWSQVLDEIIEQEGCQPSALASVVDGVRDVWIQSDLAGWLAIQQFYPGTVEQLKRWTVDRDLEVFIVSTKEGRFIHQLLGQAGVEFPRDRILGKEVRRPKYETLRLLLQAGGDLPSSKIWFVEDRLKALELVVAQPDLKGTELFLADWGYNLERDRQQVNQRTRIRLLSLNVFNAGIECWCR